MNHVKVQSYTLIRRSLYITAQMSALTLHSLPRIAANSVLYIVVYCTLFVENTLFTIDSKLCLIRPYYIIACSHSFVSLRLKYFSTVVFFHFTLPLSVKLEYRHGSCCTHLQGVSVPPLSYSRLQQQS